jgi:UDP-N-acetylglucosamine--N-acetylmuramyl-(pentapeptide) pyrophosphoryl-undecaprenol N-acetylglucosamine transferase
MSGLSKIIISGGGSGGHIFPALAIANALKHRYPNAEFLFVGAEGKMEMEKVPLAGYKIIGLKIAGFQRGKIIVNLTLPFKLLYSILKAFSIVLKFKPDVAIGVGGYASGPLLFVASVLRVPTIIQEQNAVAGLTNKLLSKFASTICVAYDDLIAVYSGKNVVKTGNPIRKEILCIGVSKEESLKSFGLDSNKKTVLIIGGSLGAKTFNEAVKMNLELIKTLNIQLIWQTGSFYFEQYKNVASGNPNIKCLKFIDRMDYAYTAADVIISRAGALSISELQVVGKPTIFVPSPNVTDDQQTKNVLSLERENAAIYIKDKEAVNTLFINLETLLENEERMAALSKNIKALVIVDADSRIVDEIEKLVRK